MGLFTNKDRFNIEVNGPISYKIHVSVLVVPQLET